jgi:hypothetical protein
MNRTKKMKQLLERMAKVTRMERGKLCRMGGRPHYNHQTWRDGRNAVRYVPAEQTLFLQDAIDGYRQFLKLAEQYANEVIRQTRRERAKLFPKQPKTKTKTRRPPESAS